MQTETEMTPRIVKDAKEARQAESGHGGRIVLFLSLSAGAILLALVAGTILGSA